MSLKRESEAVLLRIFIGEADTCNGKPLYRYIVEYLRREGIAGATVTRGVAEFGQSSRVATTNILRLSTDLPIIIEAADIEENIDGIKPELSMVIKEGLITEERVSIVFCGGVKKAKSGDEAPA